MSLGVVMLVHTGLNRAEQLARHWVRGGCHVVIHVDRIVRAADYDAFVAALSDVPQVSFSRRFRCEWGTWGLVAATQVACEQMLARNPGVGHVFLASGACLPLRPVRELRRYLAEHRRSDFIESATTDDVEWTVSGLDIERFTLRFPFAWKRQRRAFDWYVGFQRRWGMKRKLPDGLTPHMGSQWWCLTRQTLSAILHDPRRSEYDAYFKRVWIPDESYFQTLVRNHSRAIESRSLTLSKFDFQGKPHIFYDDHLALLRRSDCFVARKAWVHADRLFSEFLDQPERALSTREPNPGHIDRIFAKAVQRRTQGRSGLTMQSRFPNESWENGASAGPYSVFHGFSDLFIDFENWLTRATGLRVHGHLFAPDRAYFEGNHTCYTGALSDVARLRDYNATSFMRSLIWNTRGERQCFMFGPKDTQDISWDLAKDPDAQVNVISGAWAIPLLCDPRDFSKVRVEAARLQRRESEHIGALQSRYARARVRIWTLSEFLETPLEFMQIILDEISLHGLKRPSEAPKMADLQGFPTFLQKLKNEGMHPYLVGDFSIGAEFELQRPVPRKPYLVK